MIEKEFVLKSVSEGYSRKRIRMNLNCIIRSAGRIRNLVALATAGELLAKSVRIVKILTGFIIG